jgi:4-hydroxyproline epimerase
MGLSRVQVIDSHTEGEPTRVVIAGGPDLGSGSIAERLERFRREYDGFRAAVVGEPRGSEVVVGALLMGPVEKNSAAAVIFFNDVGYLGMCGHGTIGLVTTLAHLGRIGPGEHKIETPVGVISATLDTDGSVTVANVASYRHKANVGVKVAPANVWMGDVAWGGNWFFIAEVPYALETQNRMKLIAQTTSVRDALAAARITGPNGEPIDHIELSSPICLEGNSSRNFVLCPGASFDRSPCGTGTSAKMACLYADGKLAPGEVWRQESILGTVFEGTIEAFGSGPVLPKIKGRAWITGETTLLFDASDPFAEGIRF